MIEQTVDDAGNRENSANDSKDGGDEGTEWETLVTHFHHKWTQIIYKKDWNEDEERAK